MGILAERGFKGVLVILAMLGVYLAGIAFMDIRNDSKQSNIAVQAIYKDISEQQTQMLLIQQKSNLQLLNLTGKIEDREVDINRIMDRQTLFNERLLVVEFGYNIKKYLASNTPNNK